MIYSIPQLANNVSVQDALEITGRDCASCYSVCDYFLCRRKWTPYHSACIIIIIIVIISRMYIFLREETTSALVAV